jgi:predicted DNA-binding ribbon-helix-helix protein
MDGLVKEVLIVLERETLMKSHIIKRSIIVGERKTSVSLEDAFWSGLKEIAQGEHMPVSKVVATIDHARTHDNLSSAIRLFVLDRMRAAKHSTGGLDNVRADTITHEDIEAHV